MQTTIDEDIAAINSVGSINMILKELQSLTEMRISLVARVTDDSWSACAVLDRADFGINTSTQLELSTTYLRVICGAVAPVLISHASRDERFKDHPDLLKYGIESYLAVPLFRNSGELFGTLCALDTEPKDLSEKYIHTFELLANLIAYELEADELRTDSEEALKLAEQTNEGRARFMGILGHDLRNPLNTIVMAANLLKMGTLEPAKSLEMSEKILKTAKRMNFLIEDLLDASQTFQGNKIRIVRKTSELRKICQDLIDEFLISNPDRVFEFYAEQNCFGNWDEGRIGQVLSNFLSNAITYGSSTKPIKINLIEDPEKVLLQVNNQGEMIGDETMVNLFRPFWRGARKRSNSSGLGLGLFIAKQIVESHGGKISVESNREYGTTFTCIFDRNDEKADCTELTN
jgi:signal transduction histidine kinase